jgi:VanZ family protein
VSRARGEAAPWARRWAPVLTWGAVILVLTSWPNPTAGIEVGVADKFAHFGVYAILGWLAARAMLPPRTADRVVAVAIALAVFAALDEVHQLWIPNRFATVADWVADLVGLTTGLLAHHLTRARIASPNRSPT